MKAQVTFSPNVVKDPLLDYLQYMKPGFHDPDGSFSPQTKIYAFEADFTGNGKMSFFITDEKNKLGPHGDSQWLVYYPSITGGFQLLKNGVDAWINGPNYIGFIPELRTNGLVVILRMLLALNIRTAIQSKIKLLMKIQCTLINPTFRNTSTANLSYLLITLRPILPRQLMQNTRILTLLIT